MPDNVKSALLELRRVERKLGRRLGHAMRSGDPRELEALTRQVDFAERRLRRLERDLGCA